MKESYGEGVASHAGPESCGSAREGATEALTGGGTGRALSREIHDPLRGADAVETGGRLHRRRRYCEALADPARSETPSTYSSTASGNRESPRLSVAEGAADRIGKSQDTRR
jgi:hypothetical protein